MKKVLLTAMAILTLASASAFGMYGDNSDWIDFLVHGNQLRARMDRLGFVLGNGTIKGTFGFKNGAGGLMFNTTTIYPVDNNGNLQDSKVFYDFAPVVSAGIGYTTEAFGIGIGYNYRYEHDVLGSGVWEDVEYEYNPNTGEVTENIVKYTYGGFTKNGYGLSVHTPVIVFNALNDSLRIAVPIQVAAKNGDYESTKDEKYLGISMDPQIRYYPGLDFLQEFRLTIKYGMNQYTYRNNKDNIENNMVSSFGFDFRTYFGAAVGDVALKPFIRITYNTALDRQVGDTEVLSYDGYTIRKEDEKYYEYDSNPWNLSIMPTLGLSANSDFVSLYLEAGLGYKAVNTGYDREKDGLKRDPATSGITHALGWKTYGEIYITPVKDLEWYFEAEIGNDGVTSGNLAVGGGAFDFAAGTGITWYLPSLNGAE